MTFVSGEPQNLIVILLYINMFFFFKSICSSLFFDMLTGEGRVGFQGGAGFILCSVKLVVARLLTNIRSLESSAAPVRSNFYRFISYKVSCSRLSGNPLSGPIIHCQSVTTLGVSNQTQAILVDETSLVFLFFMFYYEL